MLNVKKNLKSRSGVSLVEVVVSTLLVGGVLVVSLDSLGAVYRTQKLNANRLAGPGIAQQFISNGMAEPFEDIVVQDGVNMPILMGWFTQVNVNWVDVNTGAVTGTDTGLKQIHVKVIDPVGKETNLYAFRWEEGVLEQAPATNTTIINWMTAQLQLGINGQTARSGTCLTNHATDE